MKRIYIAIALLILSTAMCITEQSLVKRVHNNSLEIIDQALLSIDSGNGTEAKELCSELNDFWQSNYTLMSAMVDHSCFEDAALNIRRVQYLSGDDNEKLKEALTELKSQINEIHKDEKISFGNIF